MICLEYRRILLSGVDENETMLQHRLECAGCANLHKEHALFEGQLRGALDVPVAEGFAERLLSAVPQSGDAGVSRPDRRRFLAAAAVAVGAVGIGIYAWRGRDDPMAMACIQFVMKEEAKSIMMGSMPREEATRMLVDTLPLPRIERIGNIRHIAPCPLGTGTAYHVVLMVPQGKVTLLVMPDTVMPARGNATYDGMHASVVPVGKGSVGVVGANAAVVDSVIGAIRA